MVIKHYIILTDGDYYITKNNKKKDYHIFHLCPKFLKIKFM